ncbi:MAG: class I SAM-dependent methyltransferase [Isosphaeraceae bacterium]
MWLESTGLEQATSETVARHKATRFAQADAPVVDLCCGVGGDALALGSVSPRGVLAVDLDPGMCQRARLNASAYGVNERVRVVRSRAEAFPIPPGAWVHIDPDRRAGRETRARRVADYSPGLDFLRGLIERLPAGALKLSPASDFHEYFSSGGLEREVISLGGECKEATVWFGDLANASRRATRLPEGATWSDRDGPDTPLYAGPLKTLVFDPDPALVRSGLIRSFAGAHGLSLAVDGLDLLTGDSPVDTAFLGTFEVEDVLPLDLKGIKKRIHAEGIGRLDIRTKGTPLLPEVVRRQIRPEGERAATLFLLGGPQSRAILTTSIRPAGRLSPSPG